MRKKIALAMVLLTTMFLASASKAATLIVDSGRLMGASGVNVAGQLYDVAFVDGSCVSLFTGCDSSADFDFTTTTGALQAAQALLEQVLLDGPAGPFDSNPSKTNGCTIPDCYTLVPYAVDGSGVYTGIAYNRNTVDEVFLGANLIPGRDLSGFSGYNFARFTVATVDVPEPATLALLGAALFGLGCARKRRSH